MDLLDLSVTLHTSGGDVVAIDAGCWVLMGQDVMGCVATGTNGGDNQAPSVETVTVDGLRIVLQNVALANRAELGDFCSLLVTGSAKGGNIHHIRPGLLIAGRKDVVFSVTRRAVGCKIPSLSQGFTVKTPLELRHGIVVAGTAVNQSQTVLVWEFLDLRVFVARNASNVSMDGIGEEVSIDKKGYLFAVSVRDEIPLAMTHETILVLLS